jgi:hypothetical protein
VKDLQGLMTEVSRDVPRQSQDTLSGGWNGGSSHVNCAICDWKETDQPRMAWFPLKELFMKPGTYSEPKNWMLLFLISH